MCTPSPGPTSGRPSGCSHSATDGGNLCRAPQVLPHDRESHGSPKVTCSWRREPAPPGFQARAHRTCVSPLHAASQGHGHCRQSVKPSFRASPRASLRTCRTAQPWSNEGTGLSALERVASNLGGQVLAFPLHSKEETIPSVSATQGSVTSEGQRPGA